MKLKFKNQEFQTNAVNAVCELFLGQEKRQSTFSVVQEIQMNLFQNEFGFGNGLLIDDEAMLENMQKVQIKNNLPLTPDLEEKQFCIEMETGTGKTYVYTKTIFELNKRYGFTKFIIVVPSVAIREGVYKSLEVTKEHFGTQYNNVPCRYFIYSSAKLSDIRQFATSNNIEIMIINIDAFKKAENIINQEQDKLGGETAMRYIADTKPIVIIDEPQSVDNTPKAKDAITSLNPLCVLRYSATHREKINLLYRLTPVDAYQMGLVKQIVVSSTYVANDFNKPYIKLLSVSHESGKGFKAKIELDVQGKNQSVTRKIVTVKPDDDLYLISNKRELYNGYEISGIDCTPQKECIEFSNTDVIKLGKAIGAVDEMLIKKEQIRRTIEAHLDKELLYMQKGIKVLSLFFIDEVKKYRTQEGEKGIYAELFEKCYNQLLSLPKYEQLKERFSSDVSSVHNGYFSQDKKGILKDTKGNTLADDDTYNTIMKDKEWLLSFDCPLRFIWSHSALKEGWDNPNVFQVCTLIEQKSTLTCRQKVGRGLRLCVNQEGERIEDKNINILHVIANESFSEFANTLQKEIEQETGILFGVLNIGLFSGITYDVEKTVKKTATKEEAKELVYCFKEKGYIDEKGKATDLLKAAAKKDDIEISTELVPLPFVKEVKKVIHKTENIDKLYFNSDLLEGAPYTETVIEKKEMTHEDAVELIEYFEKKDYITKTGRIKDTMKRALSDGTLELPEKFEAARECFEKIIVDTDRKVPIRDHSKEVTVKLKKQMMLSPQFQELWNKIKQKTTYRVKIDTEKLVCDCVKDLKEMPPTPRPKIVTQSADIQIKNAGVSHTERGIQTTNLKTEYEALPNIITIIAEECLIKRETVRRILFESERSVEFLRNPQAFLEKFLEIVRNNLYKMIIDGIQYIKVDGKEYYAQEIFDSSELKGNLDKDAVQVKNSIYDYVIYDSSTIEKPFALALDDDPDVKLFFKLPPKFKVDTPIGSYNPDWAVYMEKDGADKLYFILETKGSTNLMQLRTTEQLKIKCGREHFKALENGVELDLVKNWEDFKIKK